MEISILVLYITGEWGWGAWILDFRIFEFNRCNLLVRIEEKRWDKGFGRT